MEETADIQTDDNSSREAVWVGNGKCSWRGVGCRVGIVGAGLAGLCAARHLLASSPSLPAPLVFEQASSLGGTWLYTDAIGKDKHGLPINASLYKHLVTNLPKECMSFPDFDYPELEESYIESEKVLQYLNDYADNYNLRQHIKLNHYVKTIAPVGKGWSLTVDDLSKKEERVHYLDAIMICNGPNNVPVYPMIEGMAKFSGQQLHSREFRVVDGFREKSVLVIGLGPSGVDITTLLSEVCTKVYLSHNRPNYDGSGFPSNVIIKPGVSSLNDKQANFSDGTVEQIDAVIYCTGYTVNYPFLTKDCKINVDQYVSPLYKHFINIEHPTMCIIGLPKFCNYLYLVDFQVRFFINVLKGEVNLPNREEMLEDTEKDLEERRTKNQRKKDYHKLWRESTEKYFHDLSAIGKLPPIPPVQISMFTDAFLRGIKDFKNFRKAVYRVIDNENFEVDPRTSEN